MMLPLALPLLSHDANMKPLFPQPLVMTTTRGEPAGITSTGNGTDRLTLHIPHNPKKLCMMLHAMFCRLKWPPLLMRPLRPPANVALSLPSGAPGNAGLNSYVSHFECMLQLLVFHVAFLVFMGLCFLVGGLLGVQVHGAIMMSVFLFKVDADFVIGADGRESVVRNAMLRAGAAAHWTELRDRCPVLFKMLPLGMPADARSGRARTPAGGRQASYSLSSSLLAEQGESQPLLGSPHDAHGRSHGSGCTSHAHQPGMCHGFEARPIGKWKVVHNDGDLILGSSEERKRRAFMVLGASTAVSLVVTVAELLLGFMVGSLALYSDGAHQLSDVFFYAGLLGARTVGVQGGLRGLFVRLPPRASAGCSRGLAAAVLHHRPGGLRGDQ
ncbi:unnamed protein product, partial [Prorocentrum cordatum]